MRHGFIGFGNLAQAIYEGLKLEGNESFSYFDIIKKEKPIPFIKDLEKLVSSADVLWLAVKPQDLDDILEQLKKYDLTSKTIVSPVAGKTIEDIERFLGSDQLIVRIMPNLAIAYRMSVTAFCTNHHEDHKANEIFKLLSLLGQAVELKEDKFDLFTSIFGSGPAFILSFIQAFKGKMQEFDLSEASIEELLLGLTHGTTQYFSENLHKQSLENLIRKITSKGGTTQAGLDYLQTHEIGKHIEGMIDAARQRSKDMSRSTNK